MAPVLTSPDFHAWSQRMAHLIRLMQGMGVPPALMEEVIDQLTRKHFIQVMTGAGGDLHPRRILLEQLGNAALN